MIILIIVGLVIVGFIVLSLYASIKISGQESRREEKEWNKYQYYRIKDNRKKGKK